MASSRTKLSKSLSTFAAIFETCTQLWNAYVVYLISNIDCFLYMHSFAVALLLLLAQSLLFSFFRFFIASFSLLLTISHDLPFSFHLSFALSLSLSLNFCLSQFISSASIYHTKEQENKRREIQSQFIMFNINRLSSLVSLYLSIRCPTYSISILISQAEQRVAAFISIAHAVAPAIP